MEGKVEERSGYLGSIFVDVSSIQCQTLRPAACCMDRPELVERGSATLDPSGVVGRLVRLAICHFHCSHALLARLSPMLQVSLHPRPAIRRSTAILRGWVFRYRAGNADIDADPREVALLLSRLLGATFIGLPGIELPN